MTDIDFMCEMLHIDDLLAQMTEEEKLGLVLLFVWDMKKAKDVETEDKMEGEITRKSVLLECLSIMRQELAICSTNFNGLEPKKGMEEAWEQCRRKVKILQELIQAYDSEPVRSALAGWQKDVMRNGGRAEALRLDKGTEPEAVFYE